MTTFQNEVSIIEAEVMVSYYTKEVERLAPNDFGKYPQGKEWFNQANINFLKWTSALNSLTHVKQNLGGPASAHKAKSHQPVYR